MKTGEALARHDAQAAVAELRRALEVVVEFLTPEERRQVVALVEALQGLEDRLGPGAEMVARGVTA